MTSAPPPRVGDTIDHYRLEHVIGVGGMGEVFGARDLNLGRVVALKVVLGQYAESTEFTQRFQREASTLARLDSPHVVSIYDHGEHGGPGGLPYIVTQYAGGGDLGRRLRERGPMPPGLAARVCSQIADALAAAHAVGVVHRDVKPANVLLRDERPDRVHVYLCDFGVALVEGSGLTTPGAVAGTWNYLAPERTSGDHGSPASDLYSVGCLLWELLTGQPPYAGSDVEVAMQHISAPVPQLPGTDETTVRLNRVLGRTLAKRPEHRYASAVELRDELRALAQDLTGGGSTTSGVALAPAPPRRRRLLVGAIALALVAAAALSAVAIASGGDPTGGSPGADSSPSVSATSTATSTATAGPSIDPEPADGEPVLGDLDGDGYGDLVLTDFDRSYLLASSGTSLGAPVVRQVPGNDVVLGDFNGDDQLDLLRVEGEAPRLSLTPVITDTPRRTSSMRIPKVPYLKSFDVDYLAADVNGDGADDVVAATPDGTGLELTVALNRGDATFARATSWLVSRLGWERTDWAVADFDGDGRDDLVHADPDEFGDYDTPGRAVLLRSTGTGFARLGTPLSIPKEYADDTGYLSIVTLDSFAAADVDGDGVDELVGFSPYGLDAVIWRWAGTEFRGQAVWASGEPDAGGGGLDGVLADVDGNGMADLVTVGIDAVRVHLSTGTSFRYAKSWRRPLPRPQNADVVGPVKLGIS